MPRQRGRSSHGEPEISAEASREQWQSCSDWLSVSIVATLFRREMLMVGFSGETENALRRPPSRDLRIDLCD
jgi:hypothetical protein